MLIKTQSIKQLWGNWLARRLPASNRQVLNQQSIFILPSAMGFGLLLMILVLFILGTNYQNNLILSLCYLLVSVFLVAMLHCYRNLHGLECTFVDGDAVEVNATTGLPMRLMSPRDMQAVIVINPLSGVEHFINGSAEAHELLEVKQANRGVFSPPRVTIKSYFPMGIFVAWTHIQPASRYWVYPKPIAVTEPSATEAEGGEAQASGELGGDNYYGLDRYQPGQSLSRIAWKQLAQQRGLWQKQFDHEQSLPATLSLALFPESNLEEKLAKLTYLALSYASAGRAFALELGAVSLPSSCSQAHLQQTLKAISAYGFRYQSPT